MSGVEGNIGKPHESIQQPQEPLAPLIGQQNTERAAARPKVTRPTRVIAPIRRSPDGPVRTPAVVLPTDKHKPEVSARVKPGESEPASDVSFADQLSDLDPRREVEVDQRAALERMAQDLGGKLGKTLTARDLVTATRTAIERGTKPREDVQDAPQLTDSAMLNAFAGLAPRQAEVVARRYLLGRTQTEVASDATIDKRHVQEYDKIARTKLASFTGREVSELIPTSRGQAPGEAWENEGRQEVVRTIASDERPDLRILSERYQVPIREVDRAVTAAYEAVGVERPPLLGEEQAELRRADITERVAAGEVPGILPLMREYGVSREAIRDDLAVVREALGVEAWKTALDRQAASRRAEIAEVIAAGGTPNAQFYAARDGLEVATVAQDISAEYAARGIDTPTAIGRRLADARRTEMTEIILAGGTPDVGYYVQRDGVEPARVRRDIARAEAAAAESLRLAEIDRLTPARQAEIARTVAEGGTPDVEAIMERFGGASRSAVEDDIINARDAAGIESREVGLQRQYQTRIAEIVAAGGTLTVRDIMDRYDVPRQVARRYAHGAEAARTREERTGKQVHDFGVDERMQQVADILGGGEELTNKEIATRIGATVRQVKYARKKLEGR